MATVVISVTSFKPEKSPHVDKKQVAALGRMGERKTDGTTRYAWTNIFAIIPYSVALIPPP